MKFSEHLSAHLTPEWRIQYIQYENMKDILYEALEKMPDKDTESAGTIERYFTSFEERWYRFCEDELEKINNFFAEKLAESTRKLHTLKAELAFTMGTLNGTLSLTKLNADMEGILGPKKTRKMVKKKKKTIKELKLAFSEFYLSIVLLQNYQQLNFTGFRKILKKHDKLFETGNGAQWRGKVEAAPFYTSKHIDKLILETEDIFTDQLEAGNRPKAMKRLRVPPFGGEKLSWVTFRVGFFAGMFVVLMTVAMFAVFLTEHQLDWKPALRMYRGIFLVGLMVFLVGINIWGWRGAGVNHVLIFELDPRNHLSFHQIVESLLGVMWILSVLGYLFSKQLGMSVFVHPLTLTVFNLAFLLNPIKIFYHKARFWLLKILLRIVTAPFTHVAFADFWLADQLNSLVTALLDFEYALCFYTYGWYTDEGLGEDVCGTSKYFIRPIIACLPAWWRFAQCLRRYADTRHAFPHLVNAGKYSTTFFVVLLSSLAAVYKSDTGSVQSGAFFYLWILAALISTCYTLTWDIKMDWGLLDKNAGENTFLREEIVYSDKWYYLAIVEDTIGRLLWTLTVSVGEAGLFHSELLKTILSLCEVMRRFIWNYLRLENEHLNNCGEFRAVRDISVVPMVTDDLAALEKMMDDEDGLPLFDRRRDNSKKRFSLKNVWQNHHPHFHFHHHEKTDSKKDVNETELENGLEVELYEGESKSSDSASKVVHDDASVLDEDQNKTKSSGADIKNGLVNDFCEREKSKSSDSVSKVERDDTSVLGEDQNKMKSSGTDNIKNGLVNDFCEREKSKSSDSASKVERDDTSVLGEDQNKMKSSGTDIKNGLVNDFCERENCKSSDSVSKVERGDTSVLGEDQNKKELSKKEIESTLEDEVCEGEKSKSSDSASKFRHEDTFIHDEDQNKKEPLEDEVCEGEKLYMISVVKQHEASKVVP